VQIVEPPDGYAIERLDGTHSRDGFSCGKEPLDKFLTTQAYQDQKKNISTTHVLIVAGTKDVVGYVTLATTEIPVANLPESARRITRYESIPAILLGRMAIDSRHQRKRLGEFLLKYALSRSLEISQTIGCNALVVDAKDENSKKFYLKYGFVALSDRLLHLYLPIATIARLDLS
jgi:predicted GNAT family N-acyltransferase